MKTIATETVMDAEATEAAAAKFDEVERKTFPPKVSSESSFPPAFCRMGAGFAIFSAVSHTVV